MKKNSYFNYIIRTVLSGQIDLDICNKFTLSFFGGQMMYTRLGGQFWLQVAMSFESLVPQQGSSE
jgi:hypothetical protein